MEEGEGGGGTQRPSPRRRGEGGGVGTGGGGGGRGGGGRRSPRVAGVGSAPPQRDGAGGWCSNCRHCLHNCLYGRVIKGVGQIGKIEIS